MKLLAVVLLSFSLCSCAFDSAELNTREAVSRGVYAVDDSLKAGRVDLAYKYSSEVVRLVTPPKERVKVEAIYDND